MLPPVNGNEQRKKRKGRKSRRRKDSDGTLSIKQNSTANCRSSWWIKLLSGGGVPNRRYTWRVTHNKHSGVTSMQNVRQDMGVTLLLLFGSFGWKCICKDASFGLLKAMPQLLISDLQTGNSWKTLLLIAITRSQTKMLLSSTLLCTQTAVEEQMRAGRCSEPGREKSCGTLDILSFWRLAARRTTVPLWEVCVWVRVCACACVCNIS